jgi:predicted DNA-binding antitoxin AbrB/MazE fold protein
MGKIVEVVYENGVFKPLEKIKLKEGERLKINIVDRKGLIKLYRGVLGEAKAEELKKYEEEAQEQ